MKSQKLTLLLAFLLLFVLAGCELFYALEAKEYTVTGSVLNKLTDTKITNFPIAIDRCEGSIRQKCEPFKEIQTNHEGDFSITFKNKPGVTYSFNLKEPSKYRIDSIAGTYSEDYRRGGTLHYYVKPLKVFKLNIMVNAPEMTNLFIERNINNSNTSNILSLVNRTLDHFDTTIYLAGASKDHNSFTAALMDSTYHNSNNYSFEIYDSHPEADTTYYQFKIPK